MNKKLINLTLASLLLCTVHHGSNGETSPYDPDNPHPKGKEAIRLVVYKPSVKEKKRKATKEISVILAAIPHLKDYKFGRAASSFLGSYLAEDEEAPVLKSPTLDGIGEAGCRLVVSFATGKLLSFLDSSLNDMAKKDGAGAFVKKFKTGKIRIVDAKDKLIHNGSNYYTQELPTGLSYLRTYRGTFAAGGSAYAGTKVWSKIKKYGIAKYCPNWIEKDDDERS